MMNNLLRPKPQKNAGLWLFVLILLTSSAWLIHKTYLHYQTQERIQLQIESLQKKLSAKPVVKNERLQQEEQKRWQLLKLESEFPWTPLLTAIEAAGAADIELLEFHPDKSGRTLQLGGEAKNQTALVNFLKRLNQQENLINVHLTHQERVVRERLETVGFEIKAMLK